MKEKFNHLNIYFKVTVFSASLLVLFVLGMSFLLFIGHPDIPLGMVVGAAISIMSYLSLGLLEQKSKQNSKGIGSIVVAIVRFVILALAMVISGWLIFEKGCLIFNIFAILGGYFYPLLVLLILTVLKKKEIPNV
ncbi:MAG TPA: hypothetical protein PKO28_00565 [Bacilli bacterium]|nr:hypothetical protein [Bacilli bacterium]HPS18648.1 hypothetical protein [Bacilli bacterium]